MLTLVVDFEADGADTLVRLQMEPHLVGHADNQVRNEAAGQTAGVHKYKKFLFMKTITRSSIQMEYNPRCKQSLPLEEKKNLYIFISCYQY